MLVLGVIIGVLLLVIGVPIFATFALSGTTILVFDLGVTWYVIGHTMFYSVTKYVLVALPLYILIGYLMVRGGLARRITDAIIAWFGHFPGGLAIASIIAVAFFGAVSGSILAGIITIGGIMIPEMTRQGYPKAFAGAVIAASAGLDTLIPPSGTAIIYSSITGVSVAKVFMAGLIPGLVQMMLLVFVAAILCRRMKLKVATAETVTWGHRFRVTYKALPVVVLPIVILGGIYTGVFLPTEAAAVGCVLAMLIGFVVYRELNVRQVWEALLSTARVSCIIFLMIATASFLSHVLIYTELPQNLASAITTIGLTPTTFLFMACLVVLVLGTFLEAVPNILVTVPVFMAVAGPMKVDMVWLYVPFCILIGVGLLTPPVSVGAYTAATVSGESPERVFRYIYPWFFLALLASAAINIFVPQLALLIPNTMK